MNTSFLRGVRSPLRGELPTRVEEQPVAKRRGIAELELSGTGEGLPNCGLQDVHLVELRA